MQHHHYQHCQSEIVESAVSKVISRALNEKKYVALYAQLLTKLAGCVPAAKTLAVDSLNKSFYECTKRDELARISTLLGELYVVREKSSNSNCKLLLPIETLTRCIILHLLQKHHQEESASKIHHSKAVAPAAAGVK